MTSQNNPLDSNPEPRKIPVNGWKFHFDAPPKGVDLWRGVQGDLLEFFRVRYTKDEKLAPIPMSMVDRSEDDRRQSTRYTPAATEAMLGWWKGGEFVVFNIDLLNLSEGGMLLEIAKMPVRSQPVWVCLGDPSPNGLAQARVLDVKKLATGSFLVRLSIHAPCPPAFFAAAGHHRQRRA